MILTSDQGSDAEDMLDLEIPPEFRELGHGLLEGPMVGRHVGRVDGPGRDPGEDRDGQMGSFPGQWAPQHPYLECGPAPPPPIHHTQLGERRGAEGMAPAGSGDGSSSRTSSGEMGSWASGLCRPSSLRAMPGGAWWVPVEWWTACRTETVRRWKRKGGRTPATSFGPACPLCRRDARFVICRAFIPLQFPPVVERMVPSRNDGKVRRPRGEIALEAGAGSNSLPSRL